MGVGVARCSVGLGGGGSLGVGGHVERRTTFAGRSRRESGGAPIALREMRQRYHSPKIIDVQY